MLIRLRNKFKSYFPPGPPGTTVKVANETRCIPKGKQAVFVYLGMENIRGPYMTDDQMIEVMNSMGWYRKDRTSKQKAEGRS